jgi:hypothetical protein
VPAKVSRGPLYAVTSPRSIVRRTYVTYSTPCGYHAIGAGGGERIAAHVGRKDPGEHRNLVHLPVVFVNRDIPRRVANVSRDLLPPPSLARPARALGGHVAPARSYLTVAGSDEGGGSQRTTGSEIR